MLTYMYNGFSQSKGYLIDHLSMSHHDSIFLLQLHRNRKVAGVNALVVTAMETLKLAFNVCSDNQGSYPDDLSVSVL